MSDKQNKMNATSTSYERYCCSNCYSVDVEVCLPGWFNPNDELSFVECDDAADELSTYCNTCGDNAPIIAPNGDIIRGRWAQ